ncbi:MAG: outer membrane lipoprotein carrier protein LolA [Desulfarculaceae bacterium]|nr:outer membrane lipoprotein carrier protein LolA [Desulfarculaceae bacterium]MCF8046038.1 outer membrane lipoprotein carrier protein LolA [Desulfarculaceae bacterium]MCF8066516.1 outer membrane lipoprotein carrier protein LolA [Desulfarculaceae bacterium]MCF8099529.1 outer membrane lipoprotein carrier protein LolA [Desulfarculaceae bacterium]MCF8122774.1 outer membrane lipoprotein carrier protein LolA [Desulfarculaceae bacterium]
MRAISIKILAGLALLLLMGQGVALATPQDKPEPPSLLAQRVQERYRQVKSLSADYQRASSFVSLGAQGGGRKVTGSGRLAWARPLKLRLEQDTPRRELIITGGAAAWWVRPQRRQADLYPLSQFTSGLTSLLDALGGLDSLEKDYKVLEASDKEMAAAPKGSVLLALEPRNRRADLKELVLVFAKEGLALRGFVIYNLVGDRTAYSFSNLKINPATTPEMFAYEPPVDFRMVDHRPLPGLKDTVGK